MITPKNQRRYPGDSKDPEHRKWVGKDWDLLGAHQFNILTFLGLRENHYLLDIGCGSFRGARFFMAYLLPGHYFAIEPEKWAVGAGIKNEVGQDFINLKRPTFDYSDNANLSVFNRKFDYIIAHSLFIHANKDWIENCFKQIKKVLKDDGVFIANVFFSKVDSTATKWNYPNSQRYTIETINKFVQDAGLTMRITDWKHPDGYPHKWILVTHPFARKVIKHSPKNRYAQFLAYLYELSRQLNKKYGKSKE